MLIDWTRVRDLRSEIGADDFAEVVDMFLEEADEVVGRLSADAGAHVVECDLHFLKGSALNLGFAELAQLCQQGERFAAAGNTDATDLDQVRASYQRSRATFLDEDQSSNAA